MEILEKYLDQIQDTSASAGLPGIDSLHKSKKPIRQYNYEQNNQEDNRKTILIDLDGVIHSYEKGFHDGSLYGDVLPGAKETINKLKDKYQIVIFTTRVSGSNTDEESNKQREQIEQWLHSNGIYFDYITSDKVAAIAYIDDRAVKFNGKWDNIESEVNKLADSDHRGW